MALLALGAMIALGILRKFGFWLRPSATDWALAGIVGLFTLCRAAEVIANLPAVARIGVEDGISLAGQLVLFVLFLEAMLLRQSEESRKASKERRSNRPCHPDLATKTDWRMCRPTKRQASSRRYSLERSAAMRVGFGSDREYRGRSQLRQNKPHSTKTVTRLSTRSFV